MSTLPYTLREMSWLPKLTLPTGMSKSAAAMAEPTEEIDVYKRQAKAMMETILTKSPMAVRYAKVAINRGMDVDLRAGLELEKDLAAITFGTEDKQEGMDAFLAKRPAVFQNR